MNIKVNTCNLSGAINKRWIAEGSPARIPLAHNINISQYKTELGCCICEGGGGGGGGGRGVHDDPRDKRQWSPLNPSQIIMGRGGLRNESSGSRQNLELNFKKLSDSLKVTPAGWLLPQTEEGLAGATGRDDVWRKRNRNDERGK